MVNEMKLIEEERIIEEEFQGLLNDYLNSNHRKKVDIITRAFNMAREAHKGARRRSGEPYIMHPLAVARIALARWDWVLPLSPLLCCTTWWRIPITP